MKYLLLLVFLVLPYKIWASSWIDISNKFAEEFTLDIGNNNPETASSFGYTQFDTKAVNLEDDMETKNQIFNNRWIKRIKEEIKNTSDINFKIDLEVLLNTLILSDEDLKLSKKYGNISYIPLSKLVFNFLQNIINPQSSSERKKAAVDRFNSYVNGHNQYKPLFEASKSRVNYLENKYKNRPTRLYPIKSEVELYLSESQDYVKGVEELLNQSGRDDWKSNFEKFKNQVAEYDAFVKENILPKCKTDFKLPRDYYVLALKSNGIDIKPESLIEIGLKDYKNLYLEFQKTAKIIADKYGLKSSDPVAVLNFMKSKPIVNAEEAEKLYKNTYEELIKIITENDFVTLPKMPLIIRVAGDAESKSNPVPHLTPPPLVNNHGERPEFVVPSSSKGSLPFDDFSFKEASYILLAHEGRPGHDLQFSTMLDNGVSIIRSRYSINAVNAEGWALYAEDFVKNNIPIEGKFVAIQMRLWRIARMFLDPQIQLGIISSDKVIDLFTKELGVSSVMANLELRRYTFEDPGNAPAYYYGLIKMKKIHDNSIKFLMNNSKIDKKNVEKCFNDGFLAMGLLPLDVISKHLNSSMKCK